MARTSTSKKSAAAAKKTTKTKAVAKKSTSARTSTKSKKTARPSKAEVVQADDSQLDPIVEIDRRDCDRRQEPSPVGSDRRKVQRRRQIDPTTCERDYSNDEIEFMQAMDDYKRKNGRMFPTCSEILEVVRSIGYHKMPLGPGFTTSVVPAAASDLTEMETESGE